MTNTTKQIYTRDKCIKITFRCDEVMADWIVGRAMLLGLTPSAFVRQLMYQQLYAERTLGDIVSKKAKTEKTETSTETAVANGSDE